MSETFFKAKVKPLEWRGVTVVDGTAFFARGPLSEERDYVVAPPGPHGAYRARPLGKYRTAFRFKTEASAKAACQRDHDTRVKALLILEEE